MDLIEGYMVVKASQKKKKKKKKKKKNQLAQVQNSLAYAIV